MSRINLTTDGTDIDAAHKVHSIFSASFMELPTSEWMRLKDTLTVDR